VRARRKVSWLCAGVAAACVTTGAHALETTALGDPVEVQITESASLLYNTDNRDTRPNQVSTLANDEWGMFYNRLNAQASMGAWQLGLRLDGVWFYTSRSPTEIALTLDQQRRTSDPDAAARAAYFRDKFRESSLELSNRYIDWIYPTKYSLGYGTRSLEATFGDFNAQFGRGLVLSVRKMDELSSDTTIRGARLTTRIDAGDLGLRLTLLGGALNPLRIDEASGRYLAVTSSVTPDILALTEAGMPRTVEYDERAIAAGYLPAPLATYAPDRVVGGQVEAAAGPVRLGTQGAALIRQRALSADLVRSANRVLVGSQSLEVPDLGGHGAAYLEAAAQRLSHDDGSQADLTGHALYASVNVDVSALSLLVELKHYRRFFPLLANVDVARAREFAGIQYSAPPTTEASWVDTEFEGFNTCVTGGRARGDLRVGPDHVLFGWVGRYHTWGESAANPSCDTREAMLNRVWDVATGAELAADGRRSRGTFTFGARDDRTADPIRDTFGNETHTYYQEVYSRYDLARHLWGPFSLQLQGMHRRRRQTFGQAEGAWSEGQHLTAVEWAPRLSAAFGVEYSTNPQVPTTYFNGQLTYRFSSDSSVSLFVGQRRGALRCVGGVCRVYPPFEGARLDVTARF
jgi:hypothetical protein